MHFQYTALLLACSLIITTSAQPFALQNTKRNAGSQDAAFHPPFRYFKLQDDSNTTIMQQIKSTTGNTAMWQGGPIITAGEFRLWPPKVIPYYDKAHFLRAIYIGGVYWTDLADETNGKLVNNSSYKFGAIVHGANRIGAWDPNAYKINFGSDYEALFVYDGARVRLNSTYVKFQDGKV